jgi:hypothetical protein
MNGTHTSKRAEAAPNKSGQRRYWSGFSVCLFIVLLSVFTWVVHRRLTQYESMQQTGGHHMTATKVCLTERLQLTAPSVHATDNAKILLVAVAFAGSLFRMDDSRQSQVRRDDPARLYCTRIKPCMAHFFFLPPPAARIAL